MSKLQLAAFADNDMTMQVLSALIDTFQKESNHALEALVVTKEQADKFFTQAGVVFPTFQGIPLEIEQLADQRATVLKTINGILTGMHVAAVREVSEVYRLLETMKEKF